MIASDETSVRVKTQWEWVFVAAFAVLQVIRPSRGADVVREVFGAIARGFGCPTVGPPSAAMPIYGKCVWPICCAIRNTPSIAATRASPWR